MRPTNCGRIAPYSSPIQGPLEAVLTPSNIPLACAKAHAHRVYRLIGGTPDTVPTDPYLWPAPHSNNQYVRVVMESTYYSLVVDYVYAKGGGYYNVFSVVDRTWTIITIHDIYGMGSLLSIVQMVKDYCDVRAPGYAQCRTCRYASSEARYAWCESWYCGMGLEIDTGTCNSWMPGTPGE